MRLLGDTLILGFTPTQIAVFATAAGLVFAIRRWRKNVVTQQRRAAAAPAPRSAPAERGSALNVRELTVEIQALLAEVEDTARRAAAQIDNRYRKLEQLCAEADERIRKLEALQAAPVPAARPVIGTAANAGVATGGTDLLSRLRQERGAPVATEDPAYRPIYQLADLGRTAREIAQELGRQPGEVELILALRKRAIA